MKLCLVYCVVNTLTKILIQCARHALLTYIYFKGNSPEQNVCIAKYIFIDYAVRALLPVEDRTVIYSC